MSADSKFSWDNHIKEWARAMDEDLVEKYKELIKEKREELKIVEEGPSVKPNRLYMSISFTDLDPEVALNLKKTILDLTDNSLLSFSIHIGSMDE